MPEMGIWGIVLFAISHMGSALCASEVVVIGDSHLQGPIGKVIRSALYNPMPTISYELVSMCGAVANTFTYSGKTSCGYQHWQNKKLSPPRKSFQFMNWNTFIDPRVGRKWLIFLGTNYLPYPTLSGIKKEVEGLIEPVLNTSEKIVWVGPPGNGKDLQKALKIDRALNQSIQSFRNEKLNYISIVEKCVYSKTATDSQKIHFGPKDLTLECQNTLKDATLKAAL